MRYSNYAGVAAALILILSCFVSWVYIPTISSAITGFYSGHTNFGHPGLMHTILCTAAIVLFLINKIGAKRINIFVCTLNFAWAIRNYILLTRCELGECPEKRYGIYLIVFFSFFIMVMSLLPYQEMKELNEKL